MGRSEAQNWAGNEPHSCFYHSCVRAVLRYSNKDDVGGEDSGSRGMRNCCYRWINGGMLRWTSVSWKHEDRRETGLLMLWVEEPPLMVSAPVGSCVKTEGRDKRKRGLGRKGGENEGKWIRWALKLVFVPGLWYKTSVLQQQHWEFSRLLKTDFFKYIVEK